MTASSGKIASSAEVKNVLFGFPTSSALHWDEYSKPFTKHPGPKAKPSDLL